MSLFLVHNDDDDDDDDDDVIENEREGLAADLLIHQPCDDDR
jgi:hypothetical protein